MRVDDVDIEGVTVIDVNVVRRLTAEGVGATEIARRMGIGRASVYRLGSRDAA